MKVRSLRYALVTVTSVLTAAVCSAAYAETFVVPNSYIIQRTSSYIGSLSEEQVRYTIVRPSEFFDVVVPTRYDAQMTSAARRTREVLDPLKVRADCAEILKDPTVATCDPNRWLTFHALPNDPKLSMQWHLVDGSGNGADVKVATAWEYGTGNAETLVGVIDSGIFQSHPDLTPNLWVNPSDPINNKDDDGNGYIDDVHGVNAHFRTSNPEDLDGHGTHVSGIIAARGNNGTGVSGVMWSASIISASVAADGSGGFSDDALLAAYDYFYNLKRAGHNVRVINASYGGAVPVADEFDAINRLRSVDVLLVAAAGNETSNLDKKPSYPASYDLDNIITVAATGPTGRIAFYSNYGESVDIAAPGGDSSLGKKIYSTYSTTVADGAEYVGLQGTSMAAPVVTGAIGLLASQRPTLSGAQLKELILSKADSLSHLTSYVKNGRFLNLGAAASSPGAPDLCPNDPDKTEPKACGCGVPDTDTDSDGTPDCQDGCASDGQKKTAGVCGCGVADTDIDGDMAPDCNDGCVSDGQKTSAGTCGCGVSDADADGNGVADCKDPQLAGVSPPLPTLKSAKGKVIVTMTPREGVKYFLKVVVQEPKGKKTTPKPKTVYHSSDVPSMTLTKLKSKSKLTISYTYYYQGTKTVSSNYSATRTIGVK